MADAGDDRGLTGGDGAGHRFIVEGPEVLHGAAAAGRDDDVDAGAVQQLQSRRDLRRSFHTLDQGRAQDDFRHGPAAPQDVADVLERGRSRGRHDPDAFRVDRQRFLPRRVEQPLFGEFLLQLLEGEVQGTEAVGLEVGEVHLVLAAGLIDRDGTEGDDLHAVLRPELQADGAAPEHDGLQSGLVVLQGHVEVSGPRLGEVGDLTGDEDVPQAVVLVEHGLDVCIQLGDRQHLWSCRFHRSPPFRLFCV